MWQQTAETILVGLGATAFIDLWSIVRMRVFGVAAPNYALVGRWIGHMPRGRFQHESIQAAEPVRHEFALGWAAHYLIGIGYAALLPLIWGMAWLHQPRLVPALAVGVGTVAAPFLLMQPGMGAGVFARRVANPAAARVHNLVTHAFFGLGLYLSALLVRAAVAA